jgi:O-acetylhomoserine (thiol)-lyase
VTGFSTNAIHGARSQLKDSHGALRPPVYDSVAFEQGSAEEINQIFTGRKPAHAYSRITNPTVEDFENRIKLLSDSLAVIAVSSGMAAISNILLALAGAGTNIVASRHMFGNTLSLIDTTLKPWGLEARYASMLDPLEVSAAIDHNTRAVFLETVTNPQLEVADIQAIADITSAKGIPLIVDNTVTTLEAPHLSVALLSITAILTGAKPHAWQIGPRKWGPWHCSVP